MINRNKFGTIKSLFVFFVLSLFLINSNEQEKLRLKQADSLSREVIAGETIQKLTGNVEFEQGKTIIKCDNAIQYINSGKYALIGNVDIYDSEQSLKADTILIYDEDNIQIAQGNVVSSTDKDTTFADEITYFQDKNKIVSKGNVRIRNIKDRATLTGVEAEYLRDDEIGKIWGRPNYIQYDSLGQETNRIIADTMEFFNEENKTIAKNKVEIIQKDVTSNCGIATYLKNEDKILLYENPDIQQTNREIKGDSIKLYLKESKLQKADVIGNAIAVSDADTLQKGKWENKLTGKKMSFFFEENKLQRVIIEDQATSVYHIIEENKYKGANEISGDRIAIELDGNTTKQVYVQSNPAVANGKFIPPN